MNEFKVRKGLIVQGSGSNILDVQGSQGQLFSVTDSLSGSLFSVNDISGIPIMEVFSDNTIKMGTFNQEAIIVSGSRTGMGTSLPQAKLHISGASNQSLLQVSSPSATSSLFVSGSGNVGIGTATPTTTLNVNGTTFLQGGQTTVRGSGATSATTALRVENSAATARLTILNDGTSAFNTSHLYVSGSGIIGIGTSTPTMGVLDINGITRIRSSNQLYFGGTGAGDWQGAISGQANGLLVNVNLLTINNSGYASPATQSFLINTSQNVAIGPHSPTARLHVSGANNQSLLRVSSPTNANILFVSGSGNIGIGTATPLYQLHISGSGVVYTSNRFIGAGGTAADPTFTTISTIAGIFEPSYANLGFSSFGGEAGRIEGASRLWNIGMTGGTAKLNVRGTGATSATTALRVENSAATARLTILDDGTSAFNTSHLYVSSSGRVGIGTTTPQRELDVNGSIRVNSIIRGSGGSNLSFLTDNSSAVTLNIGGAIIGTLYDTTPNSNEIRTSNNQNLSINARGSGSLFLQTVDTTRLTITGSNIGIGTTSPSANLHISGASANSLLRVGSPSNANILFVTGSGRLGIGTSTPSELFEVVRSGNTKIAAGDNVGIQTTPSEWIHLHSTPGGGKYLQIDAEKISNDPGLYPANGDNRVNNLWGNIQDNDALGTPDYWMEIKIYNGNIVLIPCYLPA